MCSCYPENFDFKEITNNIYVDCAVKIKCHNGDYVFGEIVEVNNDHCVIGNNFSRKKDGTFSHDKIVAYYKDMHYIQFLTYHTSSYNYNNEEKNHA